MKFWNVARRLARGGVLLVGAWCLVFCASAQRVTLNFNPDWKFIKDDPAGAQAPAFNDSGWADVSAPHTYNDTDTFDDWSIRGHHGEQNQWGGRTWYRKTFTLPQSDQGKRSLHRIRSGAAGGGSVSQWQIARHQQNRFHTVRIRPDALRSIRQAERARGDVRQSLHERPAGTRSVSPKRRRPTMR